MTMLMKDCQQYIDERTGTYEFRTRRYRAVARLLEAAAPAPRLHAADTLMDLGACMTEFDYYLRTALDWRGRYVPIDGAMDGTDLNDWVPPRTAEWIVGIEIIEHLRNPIGRIGRWKDVATKGIVLTTPNPEVVDVLAIDRTHVTPVHADELRACGFTVEERDCFGKPGDTLLAWWYAA